MDIEQLRMDYELLCQRHQMLRKVIQDRDDALADVTRYQNLLRQARRRVKEATWNLATLLERERKTKDGPRC